MAATPRSFSAVPAVPTAQNSLIGVSIPASDPLGDALEQRAHNQIVTTVIGDAPAGGAVNASDPLSDLAWQRGLARHFDEGGNPAPHPATGK